MKHRDMPPDPKTAPIKRIIWTVIPLVVLAIGVLVWSQEPAHGTNVTVYESPT